MPLLGSLAILLAGHDGIDHGRGWFRAMEHWISFSIWIRVVLLVILVLIASAVATVIIGIPLSALYLRLFGKDDPDEV